MTLKSLSAMATMAAFAALLFCAGQARAQTEFPPPSGKGPVVVLISGTLGADAIHPQARQLAALGYDVVLLDGNEMAGNQGVLLRNDVQQAQSAPHGTGGKVGVVGLSLGGGEALAYAVHWPDIVAVVVVWYPVTKGFSDPASFAARLHVPVLMFAGGEDDYVNCCLIDRAHELADAAQAAGASFSLVTYAEAWHDFILQGEHYDAQAATDSWQKAAAMLAKYLPQ